MSVEDLQTDKLELINWISKLQDTSMIKEIKKLKSILSSNSFKQKLINQAIEAEKSYERGDITSHQTLRNEVKNW